MTIGLNFWTIGAFVIIFIIVIVRVFMHLIQKDVELQDEELKKVKKELDDLISPDKRYEQLGVDILVIELGKELVKIADYEKSGLLPAKIAVLRHKLVIELGYIIPRIRITDNEKLKDNEYSIYVRGNPVLNKFVDPGLLMAYANECDSIAKTLPENETEHCEYIFENRQTALILEDIIIKNIKERCIKYADEIITLNDVSKLIEFVRKQSPVSVDNLIPHYISIADLRRILVNLVREKVSIKDIVFIFDRLCDFARFSKEPDILSEKLRAELSRQICLTHVAEDKTLYTIKYSSEWEKILSNSCQKTEFGTMLPLNEAQMEELVRLTTSTLTQIYQSIGRQPVILCSQKIRLPLYQLLEKHIPTVTVISNSELISDIRVESIGIIDKDKLINP